MKLDYTNEMWKSFPRRLRIELYQKVLEHGFMNYMLLHIYIEYTFFHKRHNSMKLMKT